MNTRHSQQPRTNLLFIGLLFMVLVGCQAFQPKAPGELAMLEQDFTAIWDAYNHCMAGTDIQEIYLNLQILHSAPKPISLEDSPIPLPKFLKELTTARSSRLAVDPRAMAASCSLHLAEIAQQSADLYLAMHIFQTMPTKYPESQYAFYVTKANQAIEKFSSVRPAALSSEDTLVH
jgi:hypothetical protein